MESSVVAIHPKSEGTLDIRPFAEYGDFVYCADDWHVLALAMWGFEFEVFEPSLVITRDIVWSDLNSLEATFVLDGAPVRVDRSPIKTMQPNVGAREDFIRFFEEQVGVGNFTIGHGWGVQWGRVLAPADLAVGQHTLRVQVTGSPSFLFDTTINFTVSPADSAPCVT